MRKLSAILRLAACCVGLILTAVGCGKNGADGETKIVFRDTNGQAVAAKDLGKADGTYQWEVVGGKPVPAKAQELHKQARDFGSRGQLEVAMQFLKDAAAIAPEWAYPPYDLGFTFLLMGRDDEALESYKKVDQMMPKGFFTAKTAVWALQKEKDGVFPKGTYLAYLNIDGVEQDAEKLKLARQILVAATNYAPALKECFLRSENEAEKTNYLARALAAQPDPETYGILAINSAIALQASGKKDEAVKALNDLVAAPDSTDGTVQGAKAVLQHLAQQK